MDQTFLLTAGHRVIPRIEIRHEDTPILLQHLVHQGGFTRRCQFEDDVFAIGEHPHILLGPLNAEFGLIDVQEGAAQELLEKEAFCRHIIDIIANKS